MKISKKSSSGIFAGFLQLELPEDSVTICYNEGIEIQFPESESSALATMSDPNKLGVKGKGTYPILFFSKDQSKLRNIKRDDEQVKVSELREQTVEEVRWDYAKKVLKDWPDTTSHPKQKTTKNLIIESWGGLTKTDVMKVLYVGPDDQLNLNSAIKTIQNQNGEEQKYDSLEIHVKTISFHDDGFCDEKIHSMNEIQGISITKHRHETPLNETFHLVIDCYTFPAWLQESIRGFEQRKAWMGDFGTMIFVFPSEYEMMFGKTEIGTLKKKFMNDTREVFGDLTGIIKSENEETRNLKAKGYYWKNNTIETPLDLGEEVNYFRPGSGTDWKMIRDFELPQVTDRSSTSKQGNEMQMDTEATFSPADILALEKDVITLTGAGGAGKSTFTRAIAAESFNHDLVPLLLTGQDLDCKEYEDIVEASIGHLFQRKSSIDSAISKYKKRLPSTKKILILIDQLDDLSQDDYTAGIKSIIAILKDRFEQVKTILISREFNPDFGSPSDDQLYVNTPLEQIIKCLKSIDDSETKIREIEQKYGPLNRADITVLAQFLKREDTTIYPVFKANEIPKNIKGLMGTNFGGVRTKDYTKIVSIALVLLYPNKTKPIIKSLSNFIQIDKLGIEKPEEESFLEEVLAKSRVFDKKDGIYTNRLHDIERDSFVAKFYNLSEKDEEIFDKFISNNEHPLEVKNLLRIMNQPRVERKIVEILNLYSGGDKKRIPRLLSKIITMDKDNSTHEDIMRIFSHYLFNVGNRDSLNEIILDLDEPSNSIYLLEIVQNYLDDKDVKLSFETLNDDLDIVTNVISKFEQNDNFKRNLSGLANEGAEILSKIWPSSKAQEC
jgi:uncharacterized protein YeeX (DUF496 family)